jgi:hypothetical protein
LARRFTRFGIIVPSLKGRIDSQRTPRLALRYTSDNNTLSTRPWDVCTLSRKLYVFSVEIIYVVGDAVKSLAVTCTVLEGALKELNCNRAIFM